jgi:hypothetical protein
LSGSPDRKLPPEWDDVVPAEVFFNEAANIVEKSGKSSVTLRAIGGVGIALRSTGERDFAQRLGRMVLGRQEYTDLDFAGLMKERNKIAEFFRGINYDMRRVTISTAASQRQIYFHPAGYFTVDVLLDKLLIANHPIDFRKRIGMDALTLTLADLLLEKIQMWESFSEKDLKDCLLLLKAHEVSDTGTDGDMINSAYIAELLSDDWGFYYTSTTNLKRIKDILKDLDTMGTNVNIDPARVSAEEREKLVSKVDHLLKAIEDHPKSFGWKMRARVGTSKQWYREVETPATVGGFGIWNLRDTSPKGQNHS